jgi:hypothetical protein
MTSDQNDKDLKRIKLNPFDICMVKNPSEAMQLLAVSKIGLAIGVIESPSPAVQMCAVRRDPQSISGIKNPSEEASLYAVKKWPFLIKYLSNPSTTIMDAAIKKSKSYEKLFLYFAVEKNLLKLAERMMEQGWDVECRKDSYSLSPFQLAGKQGALSMAALLKKYGANIQFDENNGNAIEQHYRSGSYFYTPGINALIEMGVDGTSFLQTAVSLRDCAMVKKILDSGASLSRNVLCKQTSLFFEAVKNSDLEMCSLLHSYGADIHEVNNGNALHQCLKHKKDDYVSTFVFLLNVGVDLTVPNDQMKTAFEIAVLDQNLTEVTKAFMIKKLVLETLHKSTNNKLNERKADHF